MRSISRAYSALFHPAHSGLGAILVLMTAIFGGLALAKGSLALALATLAPLAGIVVVTRATLSKMADFDADMLSSAHRKWAMSADTPDEARMRMSAPYSPSCNIDGIPMVGESGVDIFGRQYGDDNGDAFDFDRFSDDAATGLTLDTTDAWASPMGMNND